MGRLALLLAMAWAAGPGPTASPASAGEADVLSVSVRCDGRRSCDFEVTVRHADEGWSHYADLWVVEDEEGRALGSRILHHPHVHEQPFTRALRAVGIPEDVERVRVRARDSHHGFGGRAVLLTLPEEGGTARSEEEVPADATSEDPSRVTPSEGARAGAP